jgi:hypothetical protein
MREGDRTVHARWAQMEVVRYDRAGKWYLEPVDKELPRQHVRIRKAAEYAVWAALNRGGYIYTREPGGAAFDCLVAALATDKDILELSRSTVGYRVSEPGMRGLDKGDARHT